MKIVAQTDEVMIITEEGIIVRTPVAEISQLGRSTQGVRVMNVADKDKVTAVAVTESHEKKSDEDSKEESSDHITREE